MNYTPTREECTVTHFYNKSLTRNASIEDNYKHCIYTIKIPLALDSDGMPVFDSLAIQTLHNGVKKQAVIFDKEKAFTKGDKYCEDHKNIGEFIFLLAARFKFDLLNKLNFDTWGFLHTEEIKKLKKNGITKFGPQIYRNIRQPLDSAHFTDKFLIEPNQLLHLLCYMGKGGSSNKDIDLIFWLNVLPENIVFTNKGKPISDKNLLPYLNKLLPIKYLLTESHKTEFVQRFFDNDKTKLNEKGIELPQPMAKLSNDPRIEQFRQTLRTQTGNALKEKLAGKDIDDYRPLSLQIGTIPDRKPALFDDISEKPRPEDHNRTWNTFDFEKLKNPEGKYILSCETGSGENNIFAASSVGNIKYP